MDIDFTPITTAPTYESDKLKLSTTGKKRALEISLFIAGIMIPLFWPVLLIYGIHYYKKNKQVSAARVAALSNFAQKNNYSFVDNTGKWMKYELVNKTYNLPFAADDVSDAYALKGTIMGYPFTYTMSSVYVKSGNASSQFPYNLFTVDLPVTLPKIFINSIINNLKGLDAQAISFVHSEDHVLEGDFPKYYSVRIEKNEQVDMYVILTPEVMDTLKRNNYFDVWLSGNQLTLLTFADQTRYFAATPLVFESALSLMREIDKIARSLRTSQASQ